MARPRGSGLNTVTRRLPDGTIVRRYYDRATGEYLGTDRDAAIERARAHRQPEPPGSSFGALIAEYLDGASYGRIKPFATLKPNTQAQYRGYLDALRRAYGDLKISAITAELIHEIKDNLRDTPYKANIILALFRILLGLAKARGYVRENVAEKPGRLPVQKRVEIWSAEDEARFVAAARPSLRLAYMLLLYTVQRPSDVLAMTLNRISERGGRLFIALRQQKTDALIEVPVHRNLEPLIRERLARRIVVRRRGPDGQSIETESLLLVPSPRGLLWTRRNFSRAWDHDLRRANLRLARELFRRGWTKEQIRAELESRHRQRRDLRRTGIVRLAEAGATTPQIAALSGHSIDYCQRIIDTYLPRRTEVALGGIELWEKAGDRPLSNVVQIASVRVAKSSRNFANATPGGRITGKRSTISENLVSPVGLEPTTP